MELSSGCRRYLYNEKVYIVLEREKVHVHKYFNTGDGTMEEIRVDM